MTFVPRDPRLSPPTGLALLILVPNQGWRQLVRLRLVRRDVLRNELAALRVVEHGRLEARLGVLALYRGRRDTVLVSDIRHLAVVLSLARSVKVQARLSATTTTTSASEAQKHVKEATEVVPSMPSERLPRSPVQAPGVSITGHQRHHLINGEGDVRYMPSDSQFKFR